MQQKFDAIIVGAGPAGCACGYKLAEAGLEVLVAERGKFPGSKNMWGGVLYGPLLCELIPDFWKEAPYERYVTSHRLSLLANEECITFDYTDPGSGQFPPTGVTILRSRFDRWLADKTRKAGAIVAAGLQVDDLLKEEDRIVGVKAGGDALPSDVVIACDGVNSLLAQKAGLRAELKPHQVKLGVKEVIALPRETIEQRFGLNGDEGIAWSFLGQFMRGLPGGGFIYNNRESLSVGIVVQLDALVESESRADGLLESFKSHPYISRLLDNGRLVEYLAHLIPTGGLDMMPGLYTDGLLVAGDAAACVIGTGLILEGANLAVASGTAAAETLIRAKARGDYSAGCLSYYKELLERSSVLKDIRTFRNAPRFLENRRIYGVYPELVCDFARGLFRNDGQPRKGTWKLLREAMKNKVSLWRIIRDLWRAKRAL